MATLATFRTNISYILGLQTGSGEDQTQLDYYVNEGIREILKKTHVNTQSQSLTGISTADYTLDSSIMTIRDFYVTSGSSDYTLERVSMDQIIRLRKITPAAANPSRFYALAGASKLMFYPTPASTDDFTLYYVPYPTALANSGDAPSATANGGIPAEYHNVIEWYALWRLADADDDASSQVGERYRAMFEMAIADMRRHQQARGGYKLGRIRVNPRRRALTPSDPSISVAW